MSKIKYHRAKNSHLCTTYTNWSILLTKNVFKIIIIIKLLNTTTIAYTYFTTLRI